MGRKKTHEEFVTQVESIHGKKYKVLGIYSGAKEKVLMKCCQHGEFEIEPTNLLQGQHCAVCSGKKIIVGVNDMWTNNPELAILMLNPEDGYKYTRGSGRKVDWKCSDCKEVIKDKIIGDVARRGLTCPKCSDGKSYPEKFMYSLLKQMQVNFNREKTFHWSDGKRYDFYVPLENMIIEVHGIQHYETSGRGRTLEAERNNDRVKYENAMNNGIKRYIIIDARTSELKFMKESIIKSNLQNILDLSIVDWEKCHIEALTSLVKIVCNLWNEGKKNTAIIVEELNLSRSAVLKYLKQGNVLNWCDYNSRKALTERSITNNVKRRKKIIQLDLDGSFIREWECISYAKKEIAHSSKIGLCCARKRPSAGGFKWMYKNDYEKYIEEKSLQNTYKL